MPRMKDVDVIVLAGGKGERLYPLTKDRAKPAVPFGGMYRIIDFTLSNCVNSGLGQIYVLSQYKSHSLDRHIQRGWLQFFSYPLGEFIYNIPAQQRIGSSWYEGTADAVETPIGLVPTVASLDTEGLDVPVADVEKALSVDPEEWTREVALIEEWFATIGEKTPTSLVNELDALKVRLGIG